MASVSNASVSAARWLVGVMALVVLSFALDTGISSVYERRVADLADDIIANALPSVQLLSSARGDLRVLENDLEHYTTAGPDKRGALADEIGAMRQNLQQAVYSYESLPEFPHEHELAMGLKQQRGQLDAAIEAHVAHPTPETVATVGRHIDLEDRAIQRLVAFHTQQGERLGLQIQAVHANAASLTAFLDAVSVALAIVATILALRQLRRTAQARADERAAADTRERELAEQNEALGHFAGRVAHDVLSPLATTQLALDIVGRAEVDALSKRALERGGSAIRRVQMLVDGLLAFSRAGGHPEPDARTEVAAVLGDVLPELVAQARQHQIALTVSPLPAGAIACSSGVLASIVSNLVRNAIKYMDEGERRIDVRVVCLGERWRFEVEDTGPGIPLDQQQRVFEPYIQLQRSKGGIGLGLATVDRLVRAHGGAVGLASRGRGALFWFELPAARSLRRDGDRALHRDGDRVDGGPARALDSDRSVDDEREAGGVGAVAAHPGGVSRPADRSRPVEGERAAVRASRDVDDPHGRPGRVRS